MGKLPVAGIAACARSAGPSASCPSPLAEEPAFRRSYTQYEPAELQDLLQPHPAARPDAGRRARLHLQLDRLHRPRQPHVHDGPAALPRRPEPHVHRPLEHGGVDRGARPVRRHRGRRAAFRATGAQKINGRSRKDILKRAAAGVLPDTIVNRPKGLFSVPLGRGSGGTWPRWSTTCCPTASS